MEYTVRQLKAEIHDVAIEQLGCPIPRGLSGMRKAELQEVLAKLRNAAQAKRAAEAAALHNQPIAGSPAAIARAEEDTVEARAATDPQAHGVATRMGLIDVPTVGTFERNEFLAFVGSRLAADFTPQERRDLDMAKYRGRYEGKAVVMPDTRFGKVVGGTHRDSDPTGREGGTLLLAVKHDATRHSHPRVTLHRAEDVVLV